MPVHMPNIFTTDLDRAWAAGFIDGEGCFIATKGNGNSKHSYKLRISATQIRRAPIDKLQFILGGTICKAGFTMASNQIWRWSVDGATQVRRVVPLLLPYLILKRREAALLCELANIINPVGRKQTGDALEQMDRIASQIVLTRKG